MSPFYDFDQVTTTTWISLLQLFQILNSPSLLTISNYLLYFYFYSLFSAYEHYQQLSLEERHDPFVFSSDSRSPEVCHSIFVDLVSRVSKYMFQHLDVEENSEKGLFNKIYHHINVETISFNKSIESLVSLLELLLFICVQSKNKELYISNLLKLPRHQQVYLMKKIQFMINFYIRKSPSPKSHNASNPSSTTEDYNLKTELLALEVNSDEQQASYDNFFKMNQIISAAEICQKSTENHELTLKVGRLEAQYEELKLIQLQTQRLLDEERKKYQKKAKMFESVNLNSPIRFNALASSSGTLSFNSLREQNISLNTMLQDKENLIMELQKQVNDFAPYITRFRELEDQLEMKKDKIISDAELMKYILTIETKTSELESAHKRIQQLEEERDKWEKLKTEFQNLVEEESILNFKLEDGKKQITKLNSKLAHYESVVHLKDKKLNEINNQLIDMMQHIGKFDLIVNMLQSENKLEETNFKSMSSIASQNQGGQSSIYLSMKTHLDQPSLALGSEKNKSSTDILNSKALVENKSTSKTECENLSIQIQDKFDLIVKLKDNMHNEYLLLVHNNSKLEADNKELFTQITSLTKQLDLTKIEMMEAINEKQANIHHLMESLFEDESKFLDYRNQLDSHDKKITSLSSKITEMGQRIGFLAQQVNEYEEQINYLNQQAEKDYQQINCLIGQTKEDDSKIKSLTQELQKDKDQIEHLNEKIEERHLQINSLMYEVENDNEKMNSLYEKIDKDNQNIISLNEKIVKDKAHINIVQNQVEHDKVQINLLNQQLGSSKEQIENYKVLVNSLNQQVEDDRVQINILNEHVERYNVQISILHEQVKSDKIQINSLNKQVENDNVQINSLNKQVENDNIQINILNQQAEGHNIQINSLNQQVESDNIQINAFNQQIEGYNIQIDSLNEEIEGYKVQINSLNEYVEDYNIQINSLNQQVKGNKEHIDTLDNQLKGDKEKMNIIDQQLQNHKVEINGLKDQVDNDEANINSLETQIEHDKIKVSTLNKRIEIDNVQINNLNQQVESDKAQINILNQEIESDKIQIDTLSRQLEINNDRIKLLNGELLVFNGHISQLVESERLVTKQKQSIQIELDNLGKLFQEKTQEATRALVQCERRLAGENELLRHQVESQTQKLDQQMVELKLSRDSFYKMGIQLQKLQLTKEISSTNPKHNVRGHFSQNMNEMVSNYTISNSLKKALNHIKTTTNGHHAKEPLNDNEKMKRRLTLAERALQMRTA